jgi:hypothetical protein
MKMSVAPSCAERGLPLASSTRVVVVPIATTRLAGVYGSRRRCRNCKTLAVHSVISEIIRLHRGESADADMEGDERVRNGCENFRCEVQPRSGCRDGSRGPCKDGLVTIGIVCFHCALKVGRQR